MKKSTALAILCGVMLLLLVAASASARDRAMLDRAVNASIHEHNVTASRFQENYAPGRGKEPYAENGGIRTIEIEIGDEFGSAAVETEIVRQHRDRIHHPKEMRERFVSKKLNREWKDVNRSFKQAHADIGQGEVERETERAQSGNGFSGSSLTPSSRTQKSARASGKD
jgi:hypothetical protein